MPRGNTIERSIKLYQMLLSGPVTVRMIRDKFGIGRKSAVRMIDNISVCLPVAEIGMQEYDGPGAPRKLYGIME